MNYADISVSFTRVHEFKHLHPEREKAFISPQTIICREYSQTWRRGDETYYPVNNASNNALYARYRADADAIPNLLLGGRLGAYAYFDMDKCIANALDTFETKVKSICEHGLFSKVL